MSIINKMRNEAGKEISNANTIANSLNISYDLCMIVKAAVNNHTKENYRFYLQYKRSAINFLVTFSKLTEIEAEKTAINLIKKVKGMVN